MVFLIFSVFIPVSAPAETIKVDAGIRGMSLPPSGRIKIEITSEPDSAQILLMHSFGPQDPRVYRGVTPVKLWPKHWADIKAGDMIAILLKKEGYESRREDITVTGDMSLHYLLKPEPPVGPGEFSKALPGVAAAETLCLVVPELALQVPAGWTLLPEAEEGQGDDFDIGIEKPGTQVLWGPMGVEVRFFSLGDVRIGLEQGRVWQQQNPELLLREIWGEKALHDMKTRPRQILGHRGAELHGRLRIKGMQIELFEVGWFSLEASKFTDIRTFYEEKESTPVRKIIDTLISTASERTPDLTSLGNGAEAPDYLPGETWAYFKGPLPEDSYYPRAPDYMLRLVAGGTEPQIIGSEPLDHTGKRGYRWFEVPYPLKDLKFPLHAGKTWVTTAGERATVKDGVVLQPENLAAFPIVYETGGKVIRTRYYAPEVNAIAREEDARGKVVLSLWLSAVRYVAPERDGAKKPSN